MFHCLYIHSFFIHSFINGRVGCFHVLATANNSAMNIGVHISFRVSAFVFFGYPEVELLDHLVVLFLIFSGTTILFSIVAAPIYIPTNSAQVSPFLHILANTPYSLHIYIF